ncbi:hypothetical protein N7478_000096 [Penicillium angulare]|uniref:uncharacterized protein n=1 Tax=Penicillium angulare TaxID=116970 RepID=UPI002541C6EF|nr:uncharacterized protein N7478_000096 [Penicillium angulare]KAJ5290845.1 hypothetical protein N7478_000096 [Penicillium angulare]
MISTSFLSPSSYDEETIVTQMTTIYILLHRLGYYNPPGDDYPYGEVIFPPAGGHAINEKLCHELHIAVEVVSLMKKIPYTFRGTNKPFLLQSRPFEYFFDEEIRGGRDPEKAPVSIGDEDLRLDFLKPWEVALTSWMHADDGTSESGEEGFDFRKDCKAHHAPTYLQGLIDDIRNLETVYLPTQGDYGYIIPAGEPEQIQVKRVLIEDYGWETEFREEDWRREGEAVCNRISDEQMNT